MTTENASGSRRQVIARREKKEDFLPAPGRFENIIFISPGIPLKVRARKDSQIFLFFTIKLQQCQTTSNAKAKRVLTVRLRN